MIPMGDPRHIDHVTILLDHLLELSLRLEQLTLMVQEDPLLKLLDRLVTS